MPRPYSMDLRERVIQAVELEGLSRRQAADRFGLGIKTAIDWVHRFRETGSSAAKPMGGCRPNKIVGQYRDWLLVRCRGQDFTLRGLVEKLAERGLQGSQGLAAEAVIADAAYDSDAIRADSPREATDHSAKEPGHYPFAATRIEVREEAVSRCKQMLP